MLLLGAGFTFTLDDEETARAVQEFAPNVSGMSARWG
jgi:hypothetical protein